MFDLAKAVSNTFPLISPCDCENKVEKGVETHIYNHFTAFAGSDLAKQLQDEGFCHVPGQVPNIPEQTDNL